MAPPLRRSTVVTASWNTFEGIWEYTATTVTGANLYALAHLTAERKFTFIVKILALVTHTKN